MNPTRSHLFAAAILALGGLLIGVTALGIAVARVVLAAGIPGVVVKPEDAALLDDLTGVLPFIVAFAALNVAAALALVAGRIWAPAVASWVAGAAAGLGGLAFALTLAGGGLASGSRGTNADGLGIIAAFVGLYAAAAIALRVASLPARSFEPTTSAAA